ncbi:MAG: MFS transporter, partial [Thermoguttaceae bacterium]
MTPNDTNKIYDETGKYLGTTIWNRGFIAMIITQFTVAMNDNTFRWLLVPIGKAYVSEDLIRTLGGLFLLVPFLIWTSIAGFITDRFSKRNVMVWCKVVEMVLLALAVGVILMGPTVDPETQKAGLFGTIKIPLLLFILFLLGSQSTFFSPSKYGSIPDLVPEDKLSEANGVIAMTTMIACVIGQVLGGFIFAWTSLIKTVDEKNEFGQLVATNKAYDIPGAEHWWVTALCLVGTAAIGLVASFFIPKLKAANPTIKFPRNPLAQTGRDLADL